MLVSVLFIIATLIIYGCVPKIRHLQEKCVMCYLVVLATAFTILSVTQLSESISLLVESTLCAVIPYVLHFSILSIFLWLNVINFELWLSFQFVSHLHLNFQLHAEHCEVKTMLLFQIRQWV